MTLFRPDRAERLARIVDRLNVAEDATGDLLRLIVAEASDRLAASGQERNAAQLEALMKAGGWIDAALLLIEAALPCWKLRRLAYDEGEWQCALSRQRELPEWLDEAIEVSHRNLALAVLKAVVVAMLQDPTISPAAYAPTIQPWAVGRG
jgi:hypothetical protein